MPRIEVRPKRVGGSIFQVPSEVKPKRQLFLAAKWII
jgi:small subunit ribosomal protein S7